MKRSPILLLSIPLLGVALVGLVMMWSNGHGLPMRDFVEYYSAGKAFLDHRNPYDDHLLLEIQRGMLNDPTVDQPIMMWNPPWALPLVAPLGWLPPNAAHILWLLVQLASVMVSVAMLMSVYAVPKSVRIVGYVAALGFSPTLLLLWYGQIGGFCLLGLAGYLYFQKRGMHLTAGAFAALTALKPHLLFAFGLMLLLDAIVCRRSRRVLLGGGIAILAAALIAWFVNPMVYGHYMDSITAQSSDVHYSVQDWLQPNVSYKLRMAVAPEKFRVQFVPTAVASVVLLALWLWTRRRIDAPAQAPGLVFVSVLCTAYGAWMFDLVVLLVPVIHALSRLVNVWENRRTQVLLMAVLYVLLNAAAGLAPVFMYTFFKVGLGLHEFLLFAPAALAIYLMSLWVSR